MPPAAGPALIDMTDPEFWQDPHPVLRAARERHPVARSTTGQHWVLGCAWVEKLSVDPRVTSGAVDVLARHGVQGPLLEWWRLMLTNLNGPQHARLRGLVARAFTPRAVERMRPRMRAHAVDLLRRHASRGELDAVADFSHELPSLLFCDLLGVPEQEREQFAAWSTALGSVLAEVIPEALRQSTERAVVGLRAALARLIAERRRRPAPDLLGSLVAAADGSGEPFADEELVVLAINVLFGGHDSSRSLLAVAIWLLLRHPDQLERLRADPGLIPSAVEEILRFEPVVGSMGRVPQQELEVEGVRLPAGEALQLSLVAANRDPAVFPDPDRFDVGRPAQRSLAFGWGPHHCLGAALARAELQEVLGVLAACPVLELAGLERVNGRPRWVPFTYIRKLESLPIRFSLPE
jgi:cytochrome P450